MAVKRDVVLGERERLTGGDPELLLDEIEPGHRLGDGVLDLQPRVDLEKRERLRVVERHEELRGAGADVPGPPGDVDRGPSDALAQRRTDRRRRALLEHLLVAALEAALALAEMQHGAVRVGEQLHLDVPGRST